MWFSFSITFSSGSFAVLFQKPFLSFLNKLTSQRLFISSSNVQRQKLLTSCHQHVRTSLCMCFIIERISRIFCKLFFNQIVERYFKFDQILLSLAAGRYCTLRLPLLWDDKISLLLEFKVFNCLTTAFIPPCCDFTVIQFN